MLVIFHGFGSCSEIELVNLFGAGAAEEDVGIVLGGMIFECEWYSLEIESGIYLAIFCIPVEDFVVETAAEEVFA